MVFVTELTTPDTSHNPTPESSPSPDLQICNSTNHLNSMLQSFFGEVKKGSNPSPTKLALG